MTNLEDFRDVHAGQTCLIIGNGPGLRNIPLKFLARFPSFGSNLIYKLEGFKPTYYLTVDERVYREYRQEVEEGLRGVTKFMPWPDLNQWQGEEVIHFYHHHGGLTGRDYGEGLSWISVTHALLQLAHLMGFTTMLCVGLDNTSRGDHFYGRDHGAPEQPPADKWDQGYGELAAWFQPRKIINLSRPTAITTLPREDWRVYDTPGQ